MATDNVTTKTTGWLHGFFKVNQIPFTYPGERGKRDGFIGNIYHKTIALHTNGGKTDATHADAVTYFYIIEIHFIRSNSGAQIATGFFQSLYDSFSFYYSGKHGFYFC